MVGTFQPEFSDGAVGSVRNRLCCSIIAKAGFCPKLNFWVWKPPKSWYCVIWYPIDAEFHGDSESGIRITIAARNRELFAKNCFWFLPSEEVFLWFLEMSFDQTNFRNRIYASNSTCVWHSGRFGACSTAEMSVGTIFLHISRKTGFLSFRFEALLSDVNLCICLVWVLSHSERSLVRFYEKILRELCVSSTLTLKNRRCRSFLRFWRISKVLASRKSSPT